jgi:hypothetical protein
MDLEDETLDIAENMHRYFLSGHGCNFREAIPVAIPDNVTFLISSKCGTSGSIQDTYKTAEILKYASLDEIRRQSNAHYMPNIPGIPDRALSMNYIDGWWIPIHYINGTYDTINMHDDSIGLSGLIDLKDVDLEDIYNSEDQEIGVDTIVTYSVDYYDGNPLGDISFAKPKNISDEDYAEIIEKNINTKYHFIVSQAFKYSIYPRVEDVLAVLDEFNPDGENSKTSRQQAYMNFQREAKERFKIKLSDLFRDYANETIPNAVFFYIGCRTPCSFNIRNELIEKNSGKNSFLFLNKRGKREEWGGYKNLKKNTKRVKKSKRIMKSKRTRKSKRRK